MTFYVIAGMVLEKLLFALALGLLAVVHKFAIPGGDLYRLQVADQAVTLIALDGMMHLQAAVGD